MLQANDGSKQHTVGLQRVGKLNGMRPGTSLTAQEGYPTIEDYVGNTPLVRLQRLSSNSSNIILAKLEGNNPAGSVKDRYRTAVGMVCTIFLACACRFLLRFCPAVCHVAHH